MSQAKPPISDAERELAAGYVLSDLTAAEKAQFETRLRQNPALQAEVEALRASLRLLPQGLSPIAPPPHLGDRILMKYALSTPPSRRRSFWLWLLAGFSLLSAALLGFDNLRLRHELKLAQLAPPDRVAMLLQRPNSRLIALRAQEGGNATGTLLFTPGKWQEVVVALGDLPPLPTNQVYRLWLTLDNGQTLPCGEFKPNPDGSVFRQIHPPETPPKGTKAKEIWVTIDDISAPLQPTGKPVLLGTI